jgi:hypothetical protein
VHSLPRVLDGELEEIIDAVAADADARALEDGGAQDRLAVMR